MAKRKIRWTLEASLSLLDILDYFIERNQSKAYSKKLKTQIKKSVSLLSTHPFLGKETDVEGIHELNHEVYQVYYSISENEISVLFIWDGRRNPKDIQKFLESL